MNAFTKYCFLILSFAIMSFGVGMATIPGPSGMGSEVVTIKPKIIVHTATGQGIDKNLDMAYVMAEYEALSQAAEWLSAHYESYEIIDITFEYEVTEVAGYPYLVLATGTFTAMVNL